MSLTIPAVLLVGLVSGRPVVRGFTDVQAVMLGAIHFASFVTFMALILL